MKPKTKQSKTTRKSGIDAAIIHLGLHVPALPTQASKDTEKH